MWTIGDTPYLKIAAHPSILASATATVAGTNITTRRATGTGVTAVPRLVPMGVGIYAENLVSTTAETRECA